MEDLSTQPHNVQKNQENPHHIRYVQELADEADAWITIPHAARITGASESMANRWVRSGRLPIRGNPETGQEELVGIPPRTRCCRLSDVKKIRPILYPDLVTSPAIRTLDVPAIPQEVARITATQEQINNDHQQIRDRLVELQEAIANATTQFRHDIQQQREALQLQVRKAYEASVTQLQQIEEQLTNTLQAVSNNLVAQQQELQALRNDLDEANADHKMAINGLSRDMLRLYAEIRVELMATMEAEQQAATSRIQSLQEEIEQAREQQQALIDQSFLPYQQHVDEALAKLERRIVSEVSQRQEQLAKMSEQIEGTSQQLALCIQTTNQYQQELAAQLGQIRQRNEQLEQTVHEQGLRLAWVESLEQTVAEQGKQLARYEQLLQLPDRLETLYRELVNRNLLRTEKNEQGTC
jgi:predicted  nucleic acid-binding Zn-ribbon protein